MVVSELNLRRSTGILEFECVVISLRTWGKKKLLMRNIVGLVLKKRLPEFAHRTGTGIVRTFFSEFRVIM